VSVAALIEQANRDGVTITKTTTGTVKVRGDRTKLEHWLPILREHKPDIEAEIVCREQAEDLREHFNERAAILEHDANLPREQAEAEAAKMTATLARNRGYTWAALRLAYRDYPAILALLPDRPGVVDELPLGVAKLAILPPRRVISQGPHHAPDRAA
jgi:hypothetical protein